MLMRRIYQACAAALFTLALWCLIGGLLTMARTGNFAGLLPTVGLSVFFFVSGLATWFFATGPAVVGQNVLGIDEKAAEEKAASLLRKPAKVK